MSSEVSVPVAARRRLAAYQAPVLGQSIWQFASTFAALIAALGGAYIVTGISAWLALPLALLAGLLVVRVFIIQHDCGHGAFFRGRVGNAVVGWACTLATFTPYASWRRQHANHHADWNNLDRGDHGVDIYSGCRTVKDYLALSRWHRLMFRLVRHPVVAQFLLPPLVFLILYRLPFDMPRAWRAERRGVYAANLLILAMLGGLAWAFGIGAVLLVHLTTISVAAIVGVWLFSVQHRFETAHWTRRAEWDFSRAAIEGSSYLRLPGLLRWFTGSIGFHHVHHLLPRVPNYRLRAAHEAAPEITGKVTTLTFWQALRAPLYTLWDEDAGRMVRFPA